MDSDRAGSVAVVGGGPAGLVVAAALAGRGIPTTVFERDVHPRMAPRFNADRSYTIDITGHGLNAIRAIGAEPYFDAGLFPFRGLQRHGKVVEEWSEPGWTGSRGDIVRALTGLIADSHGDLVRFEYGCSVESVDVHAGSLMVASAGAQPRKHAFDLVIGADGAGSTVRRAMQDQVAGFAVQEEQIPNYVTMVELDRVPEGHMDPHYLHLLATGKFCVAGAIRGDPDSEDRPRWFCAVGTKEPLDFSSPQQARRFLQENCPEILELASDAALDAFAGRTCYHVGRKLACSQLHGGKAVLVGDASAPFPPIGQGVNAAMESAIALDRCVQEEGHSPAGLVAAAESYNRTWKPESDAIAWISTRMLFDNRLHSMRAWITVRLGINVIGQAKSSTVPYSEVQRRARRLWPLWAW